MQEKPAPNRLTQPLRTGPERGPKEFRFGEYVPVVRVGNIVSLEQSGSHIYIKCEALPHVNTIYQWHETRVHRIVPEENSESDRHSALYMDISFWSPHVFRFQFSQTKPPWDSRVLPNPEHRMLIGSPQDDVELQVTKNERGYSVKTEAIELEIESSPFRLRALDLQGKAFWGQRRSELLTSDLMDLSVAMLGNRSCCFEAIEFGAQDEIFGLGERFDYVPRSGKAVDFWNQDVLGASTVRSYLNVPFFFSTAGYGLFVNSSCRIEWEIGTLEAFCAGFGVEDNVLDYFVIHGPSPKEILRRYCGLTGFAPLPPVWSFGLWMSRNSYLDWDVVFDVAKGLRTRKIPADVIHLDSAWFKEDFNCDLKFSEERFPEPEKHMEQLKAEGFRVSLWQWNYVSRREDNINFVDGREKGFFAKGSDGELYGQAERTKGEWINDAIIDFTNPDAAAWYSAQIENLLKMGAATIKTDFGEGIPSEAIFKEISGDRFHNLYSLVYNATIFNTVKSVTGESIVWARSGTAGSQRYPVHWGGDSQSTFEGMAGSLRGMLSAGLSGFSFFSHDIGGFLARPDSELYVRWAQLGFFSSHSRCHGAGNDNAREPWTFGEEANDIFVFYDQLRYRLLPYIINQAKICCNEGIPLVRALVLEFPEDINVWRIQDQYMFGDAILVAPVLEPLCRSRIRKLYLPQGIWYDFWTKEKIESFGEWIETEIDLKKMPMYIRSGRIIPYGKQRLCTNNEVGEIKKLEIYPGKETKLNYDDKEKQFAVIWDGTEILITGHIFEPEITVF